MIDARCTNCAADYQVQESLAGNRLRCKQCGSVFVVPSAVALAVGPAAETPTAPGARLRDGERDPGVEVSRGDLPAGRHEIVEDAGLSRSPLEDPLGPLEPRARRSRIPVVLLLVVVLAAIVGLGAYLGRPLFEGRSDSRVAGGELTHRVSRGDLVISFTERGNIRAASSKKIFCLLEGRSTIVTIVREGTVVKEGDLLVELDSSSLTHELNQQRISVDTALAALEQARQQVLIQESLGNSEIRDAELALELAEIDLKKYQEGDYKLAKKKAEQEIFIAEEELARAKNKHDWTEKLAAKGYVNRMELQVDKLAVEKAKVQHEQAEGSLNLLEQYTKQKELKTYENTLKQATDALDRVKRKAASELAQAKADEKAKESTYELSRQRLQKLEDQLGKTKIFAPQDGMVVYEQQHHRGREQIIESGAEVFENQLLMTLPDVSTMAVEVQVQEAWIDQVKEGQQAWIEVTALQNVKLTGHVVKVGVLPDYVNRWLNPDLKVYETEIVVDDGCDTSQVRPGMSSKVQIVITKLKDALFVPVQSVTTIDRERVCYVWNGDAFRPQPVQCGLFNESFIEVTAGLEERDLVQLNAPPASGGDTVEEPEEEIPVAEGKTPGPSVPGAPGEGVRSRGQGFPGSGARQQGPGERRGQWRGASGDPRQRAKAMSREGGSRRPGQRGGQGRRPRGDGKQGREDGKAGKQAPGKKRPESASRGDDSRDDEK